MYQTKKALDLLVKQIDANVKQIEEDLGAKSAKSYEEYCNKCGVITGLLTVRRNITDLTKTMENSDE
jgi:hypothetical protein